jgi:SAM-dependent methyltransferase
VISKIAYRLASWISRLLRPSEAERLVDKLVRRQAANLAADEALRFLFRLDAATYSLEGPLAGIYEGDFHSKHRHTRYHEFFLKRVKTGERVLDVGCGAGAVDFDLVSQAGAHVDGVDLDAEKIVKAKKNFSHPNLSFAVQDALTITPAQSYDTVILSNVLEHLNGRPEFLKRLQSVSGAKRIFIRVPLFERDWRVPLRKELGVEWRLDLDHKTEFTLESFAAEMDEAGLQIDHLEVHWGEIWSEVSLKK